MSDSTTESAPGLVLHSENAELGLLFSVLADPNVMVSVAPMVRPEDFFDSHNAAVYAEMLGLYKRRRPLDYIILEETAKLHGTFQAFGGEAWRERVRHGEVTPCYAMEYAELVVSFAERRRQVSLADRINAVTNDPSVPPEEANRLIRELMVESTRQQQQGTYISSADATALLVEQVENRDQIKTVKTGYVDLDRFLGGFFPGQLIAVGARTGRGKSAFAIGCLHHHCVRQKRPAGLISLEMTAEDVFARLVAIEGQLDVARLKIDDRTPQAEQERFYNAAGMVSNGVLTTVRRPSKNWPVIEGQIRELVARFGAEFVVVDYVGLIGIAGSKDSRVRELSEITAGLKVLAMNLNIPILALQQLNREVEARGKDAKPKLSDFRESGSFEQDSDVVIFPHRKDEDTSRPSALEDAEFIIAKNRNGQANRSVRMLWQPHTAQFLDVYEDGRR